MKSISDNEIIDTSRGHKTDVPVKPGKGLNAWLRKTVGRAHRSGDTRQFPKGYGTAPWPMLERLTVDADDNGTVHVDYAGDPHFSKLQIDTYIAEFCKLNHLKAAA